MLSLAFPGYGLWWAAPPAIAILALVTVGVRGRAGFGLGLAVCHRLAERMGAASARLEQLAQQLPEAKA